MKDNLDEYNENIDEYDKFEGVKSGMGRLQVDSLAELGNIGAGASSRALSKFLSRDVSMSLPYIHEIPQEDLVRNLIFKKELYQEEEVAVICINVCSPHQFYVLCVITKDDCKKLLKIIFPNLKKVDTINDYTPVQKSLIKEMGSILIIHYVMALNKLLGVEHELHAPNLKIGTLQSILEKEGKDKSFKMGINLNVFTIENKIYFDLTILPVGDTIKEFLSLMGIPEEE